MQAAAVMLILDAADRIRLFRRIQPLPLLVERALQAGLGPDMRHRQRDDDGVVDGQQHEHGHGRPCEGAFFGEEGAVGAPREGLRPAETDAREDREEEGRDRGRAGDGHREAVDALQSHTFVPYWR